MNENRTSSLIETMTVIISLMGLTSVIVGIMAFAIADTWLNAYSITFVPVGVILLGGSSIIKPRLGISLFFPAGIVALSVGLIGWGRAPQDAASLPYILPTLLGAGAIVAVALLNIPLIMKTAADRRGVVGANVVVMCALAVVIAVAVNYLGSKYYSKSDLTSTGRYTLSSKTKNVLQDLDKPVKVTVVMPPTLENQPSYEICYKYARTMLEDYVRLSDGKVSVRYLNPEDVAENKEVISFFKEAGCRDLWSIVFQSVLTEQVKFSSLFDKNSLNEFDPRFKGESAFTSAIIKVTSEEKSTIYFTTGNGEKSLSSEEGLATIAPYIKADNYELKELNIKTDPIPADCDILAIVGPRYVFSDTERDAIANYLNDAEKPGRLLVALDSYAEPTQPAVMPSRLPDLLAGYGIEVRQEVTALDEVNSVKGRILTPNIYARLPEHEITEDLQTTAALFPVACMVQPKTSEDAAAPKSPFAATTIAETSPRGWGETGALDGKCEYSEGDDPEARPLPLAACSQVEPPQGSKESPKGPRLVVIGDSDFVTERALKVNPANVDFMLNCINWLAGKKTQLGIAAKPLLPPRVKIDPMEQGAIFFGTLIGLPYIALVIGGIVFWRRSR